MRPPSYETFTPPSLPSMIRCGSCSSHHIVRKSPNTPRKNSQVQVLPPSFDSYIESLVTMIWFGSAGFVLIWLNEYGAFDPATSMPSPCVFLQVLPPSSLR